MGRGRTNISVEFSYSAMLCFSFLGALAEVQELFGSICLGSQRQMSDDRDEPEREVSAEWTRGEASAVETVALAQENLGFHPCLQNPVDLTLIGS